MKDRRHEANRESDMRSHADPTTPSNALVTGPQPPRTPQPPPRVPCADVVVEFTRRDLVAVIAVALAFALTPWMLRDPEFIRPPMSGTKKGTSSAQGQAVHVCGTVPVMPPRQLPRELPRELPRKRCVL